MPNGKTHDTITFILLPIVILSGYFITKNYIDTLILSTLYLFSSLMFNGDLDMNTSTYNRWYVLKMIWIPYQLMFHHRSIFTHGIIIGTTIRIIYIGVIPFLILYYNLDINILTDIISSKYLIIGFIGLESGNTVHTLSDKIF